MVFKDDKEYDRVYDVCQRVGKASHHDDFPMHPIRTLQDFEKWVVDFIDPIIPTAKHFKAKYIITTIDYLSRWVEAKVISDCSMTTIA